MEHPATAAIQSAELLLQQGREAEARALLAAALRAEPTSAPLWWAMSQAVEQVQQEMDCLERVLRFDPSHPQARLRLDELKSPLPPTPEQVTPPPGGTASAAESPLPAPETALPAPPQEATWIATPPEDQPLQLPQQPTPEEQLSAATAQNEPFEIPEDWSGAVPAQPEFDLFKPGAFEQELAGSDNLWEPIPGRKRSAAVQPEPASLTAEKSEAPAWALPPEPEVKAAEKPRPRRKNSWVLDVVIIGIVLCLLGAVVAYFLLKDIGLSLVQDFQHTQAVAQVLTSDPPQSLPPTWTPTLTASLLPSETPTLTFTPETPTLTPSLLFSLTPTLIPSEAIGVVTGKYPPDFTLLELSTGNAVSLSDFKDQAVLVFFWATWCPYCDAEMVHLQQVYAEYQAQGFMLLAVNQGETLEEVQAYAASNDLLFPILLDPDFDVTRLFGATSIPYHVFINRSGKIVATLIGSQDKITLQNNVKAALRLYPTSTP